MLVRRRLRGDDDVAAVARAPVTGDDRSRDNTLGHTRHAGRRSGRRRRRRSRRRRRCRSRRGRRRRRRRTARAVQRHVGARVERLGGVAALPDGVEDGPAVALGQVHTQGGGRLARPRTGVVHEFEVGPAQSLRRGIEAFTRDEDLVVLRRVRRRRGPRECVLAVRVGLQIGRLPLSGRTIEDRVLLAPRGAQLAVGDDLPVLACGGTLIDLIPVVEGLRAGAPCLSAQWRRPIAVEALPDA